MNWRRHRRGAWPVVDQEGNQTDHQLTVDQEVRGLFGRDSRYMILWALQLVVAATLTPVTTRILGPEQFGGVTAALAVMQVVSILAGLGLQTAIQRQYATPDGIDGARRLLFFCIIGVALVIAVLDLTGPVWSGLLGFTSYGGALRLAIFWAGLAAFTSTALALLRSQDRLLAFSVVCLLQSIVAEATAVSLALLLAPTAKMFVLGELLAQGAAAGLALVLIPPLWLGRRHAGLAAASLVYALPLVPAALSHFVLGASDRLIIQNQLGATAVARYQIAYNIGSMPTLLLDVLDSVWMPRIFALANAHLRADVLGASRDALYRLLAPVMIGLALGSPIMLALWAPPSYLPAAMLGVTCVVIVSAVPYAAGLSATRTLLAQGHSRSVALSSVLAAVVNVLLNLLLVPRYELMGAAVATLLAFALLHALLVLAAGKQAATRPAKKLVALLAAAAAVTVASAAFPTTSTFLALRVVGVVACLGWFFVILLRTARSVSR